MTQGIEDRVRQQLMARVDAQMLSKRDDPAVQIQIRRLLDEAIERESAGLSRMDRARLIERIMDDVFGYGPIQGLISDPAITEIMVNRWDQVYYEKEGRIYKSGVVFRDEQHVRNVIEKIVAPIGRRIDESSPMVDARLPDGSRVNAVIPPLALDGSCLTIRKFGRGLTVSDLIRLETLSQRDVEFLEACVKGKLNMLISGGTGSGKTTVLNVLSSFIPMTERIITIEDAAELRLQQEHVVRLESRPPNIEGKGEVPIRSLVKNALRMRPDRIIVGEVRGGEALDMLQAMNTGHEGSLTTLHANSPRDAIARLEVMVLMAGQELPHKAIREQIASSIDLVLQVARMRDGSRKIVEISEVKDLGEDSQVGIQKVFAFQETGADASGKVNGFLKPTGCVPACLEKMAWHGVKVDTSVFGGNAA
jgi:pilus assembly protein CpaF